MADEKVGVAPGTLTVVMPNGDVIELVDWIEQHIYGMIEWTAGDNTELIAFSSGQSVGIPGGARPQTRADTNVPVARCAETRGHMYAREGRRFSLRCHPLG